MVCLDKVARKKDANCYLNIFLHYFMHDDRSQCNGCVLQHRIKIRCLSKNEMGAILHGYLFENALKTDIKMRSLSKFSITFKVQRLIYKESTLLHKSLLLWTLIVDKSRSYVSSENRGEDKDMKFLPGNSKLIFSRTTTHI